MADDNITVPQLEPITNSTLGKISEDAIIYIVEPNDPKFEHPDFNDGSSYYGTLNDLKVLTDGWRKVTILFNDAALDVASAVVQKKVFDIPVKGKLSASLIKTNTAFTGVGLTNLTVELGLVAEPSRFLDPHDLLPAVSDVNKTDDVDVSDRPGWSSLVPVYATFRGNTTLDNLASGSVEIYYKTELLP